MGNGMQAELSWSSVRGGKLDQVIVVHVDDIKENIADLILNGLDFNVVWL